MVRQPPPVALTPGRPDRDSRRLHGVSCPTAAPPRAGRRHRIPTPPPTPSSGSVPAPFLKETLERLWDTVTSGAFALSGRAERFITGRFGSSNARYLRRLDVKIEAINLLESATRR